MKEINRELLVDKNGDFITTAVGYDIESNKHLKTLLKEALEIYDRPYSNDLFFELRARYTVLISQPHQHNPVLAIIYDRSKKELMLSIVEGQEGVYTSDPVGVKEIIESQPVRNGILKGAVTMFFIDSKNELKARLDSIFAECGAVDVGDLNYKELSGYYNNGEKPIFFVDYVGNTIGMTMATEKEAEEKIGEAELIMLKSRRKYVTYKK